MNFEILRKKYKPEKIQYLLIAETPPKSNSERFFYMENVTSHDSLFLETVKVLYPQLLVNKTVKEIRNLKSVLLSKLQKDGFYLIDSLEEPFEEMYSSKKKISLIKKGQQELLTKIKALSNENTKVILISSTVFQANYLFLIDHGIPVIHNYSIDFPGSGGQTKFREKIKMTLNIDGNASLQNKSAD